MQCFDSQCHDNRDPEKNFEFLWKTFHNRYPFFDLRNVDWKKQYETYRPKVTNKTSDDELFDIFCQMLGPLNDGHVELIAKTGRSHRKRYFNPEKKPQIPSGIHENERSSSSSKRPRRLLSPMVSGSPAETQAWMLHYCRSREFGYIRILELEGVKKRRLTAALDKSLVTSMT